MTVNHFLGIGGHTVTSSDVLRTAQSHVAKAAALQSKAGSSVLDDPLRPPERAPGRRAPVVGRGPWSVVVAATLRAVFRVRRSRRRAMPRVAIGLDVFGPDDRRGVRMDL